MVRTIVLEFNDEDVSSDKVLTLLSSMAEKILNEDDATFTNFTLDGEGTILYGL